jgi:hypothetical protein
MPKVCYGLTWIQQPAENMYPIIKERAEKLNWSQEFYEEQIKLYNIFHEENDYLEWTDERQVRFCLKCKIYYKPSAVMSDVNINLCWDCFTEKFKK